MKSLSLCFVLVTAAAWAQQTIPQVMPPPVAPPAAAAEKGDTVIAIFEDGSKLTLDEYTSILPVLPQQYQQLAAQNRERFLHVYGMVRKAAGLAKSQKLDEKSPYKQSLEFTMMFAMADFAVKEATNAIVVDPADVEKYYNEHKDPFKQVKVSGIKVAFGGAVPPPASTSASSLASVAPKKVLTEEEAKAKAEKLVAQLRAGADFGKMVLLESDDESSKAKGGELATFRFTDNVPDDLRTAVFGLKEGEVSNPVKQTGAYYVLHADTITFTPLSEVRDTIFSQLKQTRSQEWMQNFDKSTKVELPTKKEPPVPMPPSAPAK